MCPVEVVWRLESGLGIVTVQPAVSGHSRSAPRRDFPSIDDAFITRLQTDLAIVRAFG